MSELIEYEPGTPFPGTIGKTLDESSPAWPAPNRSPEGSPNVVVFVLDDVGFGQLSPFGGLCETPTLDRFQAGLAGLEQALAEWRNLFGDGHWRPSILPGLQARHARLAVDVAETYVRFLVSTLDDLGLLPGRAGQL